jgi:hypothetical protein
MLEHRLTPPPVPTYSLNRKLSGAFLMCAKLGANVDCKALWEEYVSGYEEGPDAAEEAAVHEECLGRRGGSEDNLEEEHMHHHSACRRHTRLSLRLVPELPA